LALAWQRIGGGDAGRQWQRDGNGSTATVEAVPQPGSAAAAAAVLVQRRRWP
jgi:hypothetical protein